ncbi:hypothetical protein BC835DRAFT_1271676 [Cytidiella melzeri]|nr:hypothetical protein BC835DRAFT_1271676 [Cytidiella melzeri]
MVPATAMRVPLDNNSLYVSTIPLTSDTFHWALIHIDEVGVHTRHHWAAMTRDVKGPEAYVSQNLVGGAHTKTDKSVVLGYFKVVDYTPLDVATFRDVCQTIFPTSYATADENRSHAITCRTWILHILARLVSELRAQEVELSVKKRSTAQSNEYANCFLWKKPFACVVEDV